MSREVLILYTPHKYIHQLFWVDYEGEKLDLATVDGLKNSFSDSVDQEVIVSGTSWENSNKVKDVVCFKPGVTDNSANSFKELIKNNKAFTHRTIEVHSGFLSFEEIKFNPIIQNKLNIKNLWHDLNNVNFHLKLKDSYDIKKYSLRKMLRQELNELSLQNCWALSEAEMLHIKAHFQNQDPTDVEMEVLAQTWSEHCKHKIFGAQIEYEEKGEKIQINSLFKEFIKNPTYALNKPWTVSLFDDNAGIVRFRDDIDLCIKVETHNSPSALDPYGGALTGILGVNRDILGTGIGAKPVANTDVFCVGMPDENELPALLIHPKDILKGIHAGVMDGGNKSGIPTINGAIHFDPSYSGKPLVYCGTVGVLPSKIENQPTHKKGQRPGDLIVMVGGDVGIDGIHGATASSLVMDQNTTLGMVQIGDPFSQKRMTDFILKARDLVLYNSITDNGAGGLSSSVGEMSLVTNGSVLYLDRVPLKYSGLLPWQILVSESQERMTLSVPRRNWNKLFELANLYQVSISNIGEFTNDGKFRCFYETTLVCCLDLNFLYQGTPKLNLKAKWKPTTIHSWKKSIPKHMDLKNHDEVMKKLLSIPTLSSKEKWVRQYDHEVQGATVVKPFEGINQTSVNNAGVMWFGALGVSGSDGFSVASGLCPQFSKDDTKLMSQLAVDEAVRNLICHGTDPDKIALVDNFCWPDPIQSSKNPDGEFKLAQLVRSCMGLKEMIEVYQMPLVSGKDSMKNDYSTEGLKISVLPTLLITALGYIPQVEKTIKSQAENKELLYRIGYKNYQQYFGNWLHELDSYQIRDNSMQFNWKEIRELYQRIFEAHQFNLISSMHDISEGGFLVTLFEMLLMNNLGVKLTSNCDSVPFLYSELPGHFIVSIRPESKDEFEKHFSQEVIEYIGSANDEGVIKINSQSLKIKDLAAVWRGQE